MINTLLVITVEPIITKTSNWHQHLSIATLSHRLVIFDLGSMIFPSAGGRMFLGQGQFCKIANSCPILLKFFTHMFPWQQFGPL
jgi:hypothetical protein